MYLIQNWVRKVIFTKHKKSKRVLQDGKNIVHRITHKKSQLLKVSSLVLKKVFNQKHNFDAFPHGVTPNRDWYLNTMS